MREREEFEEEPTDCTIPHQSRAVGTTTSLVGAQVASLLHHQHRKYAAILESDSTSVTIVSSHYCDLFTRVWHIL